MGCVSSKLLRKNLKQELLYGNGDVPTHVVSLTSSTYGVLKLDQEQIKSVIKEVNGEKKEETHAKVGAFVSKNSSKNSSPVVRKRENDQCEVINAWELMGDLEEETIAVPNSNQSKKSPKLKGFRGGYLEKDEMRSPFKCLNQVGSPKTVQKLGGKENNMGRLDCYSTPKGVSKSWKSSTNSSNKLRKASSLESPRRSNSGGLPSRRKSLSPLFDPELIDCIEKELSQEKEQIKKMVSPQKSKSQTPKSRYLSRNSTLSSNNILGNYVEKCPPGGENSVVIYTTTLRGIRKTFEACNVVRSVIESYPVRLIERDISMDSGFKEELRKLMGTKEVKVPVVFVKGRLIGGADEVVKLDEEGKLGGLFDGILPKLMAVCDGCGGVRFIMCMDCNGSCKILDEDQNKMVRCGECNENGIVQCPICC